MPRLIPGFEQMFDGAGNPLVDGLLDFFESGSSSVRKDTFKTLDEDQNLKNANPVKLTGDGRVPNVFGTGEYNVILRTAEPNSVQILPRDPIGGDQDIGFGSDWVTPRSYFITDVVREDGFYWESLVSQNIDKKPSLDDGTNWDKIDLTPFGIDWNKTRTYEKTDVTRDAGKYWESIAAANQGNQPSVSEDDWKEIQFNPIRFAVAGGTADVLTAEFDPPLTAADLTDGQQVRVRALLANATTTPTFTPDGLDTDTITKNGNQPLALGDIPGVDFEMILRRNTGNSVWELLNPADATQANLDLSNLTDTGNDRISTAWVSFDGTGTLTIKDSFNVSSVTDNGTGQYEVNFAIPQAGVNYGYALGHRNNSIRGLVATVNDLDIQTFFPSTFSNGVILVDDLHVTVAIYGRG